MALDQKTKLCMVRLFVEDVETMREYGFNISSVLRRLLNEESQRVKNRRILEQKS